MSLDVYLTLEGVKVEKEQIVFVRENGATKSITLAEWNERYPDREPITIESGTDGEVYSANITHNLAKMVDAAGIYEHLWRPDEVGIETASQLIDPLSVGLDLLKANPDRFKALNPPNGWGTYEGLVEFIENYIAACWRWPNAKISASV